MRALVLLAAAAIAAFTSIPARADLVFPSLSYRTGPYAAGGIPLADGYTDYFTLLNERDGGINGVRLQVPECETAYNTEKGVECYELMKSLAPVLIQPLSTGIAYRLISKATSDGIPMHTMGYGRSSVADGTVFPWIFNYPVTYWDAATIAVRHMLDMEGGSLAGKRVAFVYHNSPYGKEPILLLRELARKHRFALRLYPVDHPGQEQKSVWAEIERAKPDFIALWSWGIMNEIAVAEAAKISFPMDRLIGVWWSASEEDLVPLAEAANGYKSIGFHATGTDYPLFDDLRKYVIDAGKAAGDGSHIGKLLYNRGLLAAVLAAEAARTAMRIHDTTEITPAMMRDGMEKLAFDPDRMRQIGLPGFSTEIRITCTNHGGPGLGTILQWQAATQSWSQVGQPVAADRELIEPLIRAESQAYAAENNIQKQECAD